MSQNPRGVIIMVLIRVLLFAASLSGTTGTSNPGHLTDDAYLGLKQPLSLLVRQHCQPSVVG